MKEKRADVVAEMKRLQAETEVITKIFEDEDISKSIQSTRSVKCLLMCKDATSPVFCILCMRLFDLIDRLCILLTFYHASSCASAVLGVIIVSVCPSVSLSVITCDTCFVTKTTNALWIF